MNTYPPLASLLKTALWNGKPDASVLAPLSVVDWEKLYDSAVRQTVGGVVFDAVSEWSLDARCTIPPALYARWHADVVAIEKSNAHIGSVVEKQTAAWKRHGVSAILLKGPRCARFYPKPERRSSGDIDWYFPDGASWTKALQVVRDNGLKCSVDSDGDVSYTLAGVVVEHHRNGPEGDGPEAELAFLVGHVFNHFSTSGVGLRQLCDLALALTALEGEFDGESLYHLLKERGMDCFFALVCAFMVRDLGLEPGYDDESVRQKDVDSFRALLLADGNFGLGKKVRFSGFCRRTGLCIRYAPVAFSKRWSGLACGRLKRFFTCNKIDKDYICIL